LKNIVFGLLVTAAAFLQTNTAQAATVFTTSLSSANEVPPTVSSGSGGATVSLSGDILNVNLFFTGLSSPSAAAHIHCCGPVGVNEAVAIPFSSFPAGISGTYANAFDLTIASTYNSAFLTTYANNVSAAEAALVAGLNSGQAYVNIHTANYPGGEIRGQLAPVPEPASIGLSLIALSGVLWTKRSLLRKS
jgi:hypothetical protein